MPARRQAGEPGRLRVAADSVNGATRWKRSEHPREQRDEQRGRGDHEGLATRLSEAEPLERGRQIADPRAFRGPSLPIADDREQRQRDDDRGKPEPPDQQPVHEADEPAAQNRGDRREREGQARLREQPEHDRAEAEGSADRDVHFAGQDHDGHAKRDDLDGRVGHREIAEIAWGEEGRRRHREDGEEGGQREGGRPLA